MFTAKQLNTCTWNELVRLDRMVRLNQLQLQKFEGKLQEELTNRKNGRK